MRRLNIISISLLSLFLFSAVTPLVLVKADFSDATNPETAFVYQQTFLDVNGDKIADKFSRELLKSTNTVIEAAIVFDKQITTGDRYDLTRLGVELSGEVWDQGHRTLVTTTKDNLDRIAGLDGVTLITSADIRFIMVAILGDDFSDFHALERYEGAQIFWGVGCALVPYYSGVENDINRLGEFTAIVDSTDMRYMKDEVPSESTDMEAQVTTLSTSQLINATGLWDMGYKGSGVKVGNIDTGINSAHLAFSGRVIAAESFITYALGYDHEDLTTTDFNGHGTHTSGTILGDDSVNFNYQGVAPEALLYFAKIDSPATLPSMIAGLNYLAADKKVDVINLSFGGGDGVGRDVVEIAFANVVRSKKISCSISAGNEGDTGFYSVGSPGTCDDVITVGALDSTGMPYGLEYYSSFGLSADDHMKPDLLAPGAEILSCSHIGNGYVTKSGTSMAAPHVTGALALLVQACEGEGITFNPGVFKAALMLSGELIGVELMMQGRGYINVGHAFTLIKNAPVGNGFPLIGALNPVVSPLHFWENLAQGQVHEQYLTTVTSQKINLTLEVTGDAAAYITVGSFITAYTNPLKVTYTIPVDAPVGTVTGLFTLKFNETVLDTAAIEFDILPSTGHRMLLSFRTTDYSIDHMYGQYAEFSEGILDAGFVISEQNVFLDSGVLANYEAVWLPDPFNFDYPYGYLDEWDTTETYNPWTEGEKTALTDYVQSGGSVFLCFLGETEENIDGYGIIQTNTNVSVLNEWTEQFGIHVRDTIWTSPSTVIVDPVGYHPLTAGVTGIDH